MFPLIGLFAGFTGSLLGLGGGVIVVPLLTLLGLNVKTAVAISIFSTIATWASASEKYIRSNLVDFKVAFFLGSATTIGAFIGSRALYIFPEKVISLIFVFITLLVLYSNIRGLSSDNKTEKFTPIRLAFSYAFMLLAGFISAILGIGAGVFKVFAMDRILNMSYRVSTATSMFLIGITASSSAVYYAFNKDLDPFNTSIVALGAIIGGLLGSRVMVILPVKVLRFIFSVVVVALIVSFVFKTLL